MLGDLISNSAAYRDPTKKGAEKGEGTTKKRVWGEKANWGWTGTE